jgi:hypothetical protein
LVERKGNGMSARQTTIPVNIAKHVREAKGFKFVISETADEAVVEIVEGNSGPEAMVFLAYLLAGEREGIVCARVTRVTLQKEGQNLMTLPRPEEGWNQ